MKTIYEKLIEKTQQEIIKTAATDPRSVIVAKMENDCTAFSIKGYSAVIIPNSLLILDADKLLNHFNCINGKTLFINLFNSEKKDLKITGFTKNLNGIYAIEFKADDGEFFYINDKLFFKQFKDFSNFKSLAKNCVGVFGLNDEPIGLMMCINVD